MTRLRLILLLLLLVAAACGDSGEGASTTIAPVPFDEELDAPASTQVSADDLGKVEEEALGTGAQFVVARPFAIIERSPQEDDFDGDFTFLGDIIEQDGMLHLFRTGLSNWPSPSGTAYHTSTDGFEWLRVSEQSVFDSDTIEFAEEAASPFSVLVEDDGTWTMYFNTINLTGLPARIGRATAPGPLGPWTPDPEPVLQPGPDGAWDSLLVSGGGVFKTNQGYIMFYFGANRQVRDAIGVATSSDGANWTKLDDPQTTETLYAESDSVLAADAEWEIRSLGGADVVRTSDGWVMVYGNKTTTRAGIATSPDGFTWTKYENNPVFDCNIQVPDLNCGSFEINKLDDTWFLYFSGGNRGGSDIYVATYEGADF
ncbi:MAG: hypothetical protein OES13_05560 [Acidimicrobiia bacterium]|nr:hypothetical protein [Acidimicrobiia bacterium]